MVVTYGTPWEKKKKRERVGTRIGQGEREKVSSSTHRGL
jgi:hypothetical protein